jgi:hypothetical protein
MCVCVWCAAPRCIACITWSAKSPGSYLIPMQVRKGKGEVPIIACVHAPDISAQCDVIPIDIYVQPTENKVEQTNKAILWQRDVVCIYGPVDKKVTASNRWSEESLETTMVNCFEKRMHMCLSSFTAKFESSWPIYSLCTCSRSLLVVTSRNNRRCYVQCWGIFRVNLAGDIDFFLVNLAIGRLL